MSSPEKLHKRVVEIEQCPRKRLVICAVAGVCIATLIVSLIVYSVNAADISTGQNVVDGHRDPMHTDAPIKTEIGYYVYYTGSFEEKVLLPAQHIRFVSRLEWLAQPSGPVDPLASPVPYVIIAHTVTENCSDQASCVLHMRIMQTFHVESRNWSDIGYNFVVGGDGSVYIGRGWNTVGAHTMGYNYKSVGVALIGTFNAVAPPPRQLVATQRLLEYGVANGKLTPDYKLFGHRQLMPSLSPGDALFNIIKTWKHFSAEL